jgi:integrase
MPRQEQLPKGFTRRPSGSLRVQIRLRGHEAVARNFPIFQDTPDERHRQMAEAKSWAEETRRRMLAGVHVSTREAETTTLADALRRYENEALKGRKASNAAKESSRLKAILADPIADRTIAQLRKTDLAAFRDRLINAGWLKSFQRAAAQHKPMPAASPAERKKRQIEISELPGLYREAIQASDLDARRAIEDKIKAVCDRDGIHGPAKTTISNVVQLVTRTLKHISQHMDGVPDLSGVSMPRATPGRERRVSPSELRALLKAARKIDDLLPLIIRFAIATALRRERVLSCRESDFKDIGGGNRAIVFPREQAIRTKRTGVVPVTREILEIVAEAKATKHCSEKPESTNAPIFNVHVEAFKSQWRRLIELAGIEDLHFHDLRHEATSQLFERGLTTAEVMSITGHSTTDMVDRYSHYSAGLVLKKLERGQDAEALLAEIGFLSDQFRAVGGDPSKLAELLRH